MKKLIFTFLLISLFCGLAKSQNNNVYYNDCCLWKCEGPGMSNPFNPNYLFIWQYMQTSTQYQILGITFKDTLKGWATHNNNGATMTTNGGINWTAISFNDTNFSTLYNGVFFLNQNTGWCVGGAVQIRKTTNGGLNWFKQTAPPVAGVLNKIYFWDENTGIAIGRKNINYNSFIAKTTNGGTNWFEIVPSTANENELSGQYWFDANTGWICGKSILLKSTNGGLNYTNYFSSLPPTSNGVNALLSITFVNQQTGWIGGSNLDNKNLYKTTNGGLNWFFQTNPAAGNYYPQINDVKFFSTDSGWAIHGTPVTGAIMFTSNGGTNWVTEEGSSNWFQCIDFIPHMKAWVGASNGLVWYSYLYPLTGIRKITSGVPQSFYLSQNYPNPFNPEAKIKFDIPDVRQRHAFDVRLNIFDISGREIQTLLNESLQPGSYEATFNGSNLSSGIYFYKLQSGDFIDTKKMLLIK
jgi:photosystem II stability/assembly factor-like uncharacterized protein